MSRRIDAGHFDVSTSAMTSNWHIAAVNASAAAWPDGTASTAI
jgi:hypothetical protein